MMLQLLPYWIEAVTNTPQTGTSTTPSTSNIITIIGILVTAATAITVASIQARKEGGRIFRAHRRNREENSDEDHDEDIDDAVSRDERYRIAQRAAQAGVETAYRQWNSLIGDPLREEIAQVRSELQDKSIRLARCQEAARLNKQLYEDRGHEVVRLQTEITTLRMRLSSLQGQIDGRTPDSPPTPGGRHD